MESKCGHDTFLPLRLYLRFSLFAQPLRCGFFYHLMGRHPPTSKQFSYFLCIVGTHINFFVRYELYKSFVSGMVIQPLDFIQ